MNMPDESLWKPPSGDQDPSTEPQPSPGSPVGDSPYLPQAPVSPWAAAAEPVGDAIDTSAPTDGPLVQPLPTGSLDRPSRSKWLVGGAAVALLAVGAAGVFAVSGLRGASNGGAASPDELGLALLSALENEDVLGAVDVLIPGERDVFRDPLVDLVSELTRLEVLSPDATLTKIAGLDVVLENESVEVVPTNVDDIVNITLHASATATVDGKLLPVGDLITDNLDPDQLDELHSLDETDDEELELPVTAVLEDGRWYFSAFYTIAEAARKDALPDTEIPPVGIGAVGGESPEAAFDQILNAVEALDVRAVIQSLNPGEAGALQRYAPLFLDDAESGLDEVRFHWTITDRTIRAEGSGDTRTIFLDGLAIEGEFDGSPFSFSFSDQCFTAGFQGTKIDQCAGDPVSFGDTEDLLADAPELKDFIDTLGQALDDVEPTGIEMRKHEGEWFVSPTATYTEAMLNVLRALTRTELDDIIEKGRAASEVFFDEVFGGLYGSDVSDGSYECAPDDDSCGFTEYSSGDLSFDDAFAVEEGSGAASVDYTECYSLFDPVAATECFSRYIAAGAIDQSYLPIELRFPECGYQANWGGGVQSLPDAEFIAAAEAARPCLLDLVDHGLIEDWELPNEISHLECFEGRNWYNTFDDPAYDERYYACLEGSASVTSGA